MSDSLGSVGITTNYQQSSTLEQQDISVLKIQKDMQKQEGEAAMKLLASANITGPVKVDVRV